MQRIDESGAPIQIIRRQQARDGRAGEAGIGKEEGGVGQRPVTVEGGVVSATTVALPVAELLVETGSPLVLVTAAVTANAPGLVPAAG